MHIATLTLPPALVFLATMGLVRHRATPFAAPRPQATVIGTPLHQEATFDELTAAIVSDWAFHLTDCPTHLPPGWGPVTTGADKKPLLHYDAKTGVYAEVLAKQQWDAEGRLIVNESGNPVPAKIMVAWRGSVFTNDPKDFQNRAEHYPDLGQTAKTDSPATFANDGRMILGLPSVEALADVIDAGFKNAVKDEFGNIQASVPWINTGQSSGGNAAIAATAHALKHQDGWYVSALAFNSVPSGRALQGLGLMSPELEKRVTHIFPENEILTEGLIARPVLWWVSAIAQMITQRRLTKLDVGRAYTVPSIPDTPSLLKDPMGRILRYPRVPSGPVIGLLQAASREPFAQQAIDIAYRDTPREKIPPFKGFLNPAPKP